MFFFQSKCQNAGKKCKLPDVFLYPQTDVVLEKEAILKAPLLKSQTPTSFLVVALTLA
jgi:hypothetical protein